MRRRERASVPVWFVRFPPAEGRRRPGRFVPARDAGSAARVCRETGLGRPSSVSYAGFRAEPFELDRPKGYSSKVPSSRRAEAALTLYSMLRTDWPIPSLLRETKRLSAGLLRDFVADVGRAIAKSPDSGVVAEVADAQGLAWFWSARALNAKRRDRPLEVTTAIEKRDLYRGRARRLRKRKAYSLAVGEIENTLNGVGDGLELVGLKFVDQLLEFGLSAEEASELARRFQRVGIPRL